MNNIVYMTANKTVDINTTPQIVYADDGYDGFCVINSTINSVGIDDIHIFIADYTNDDVNLTTGIMDKYYRRIYGK